MKLYPKHNGPKNERGFTEEEIKNGTYLLYIDVECTKCGKIQSLAMAGSLSDGKCINCGSKTK